ncbi:YrdB family protein [Psychromicrobium sp. YIM B11713]|uniref:YrdB family protein n=1 Tax=Psychromicrobium sp. YIM B11713 TaxID=3145233 RepID=UPI00374EAF79
MQKPGERTQVNQALTGINGVIAFILEVAMLVAFFFWGFRSFPAPWGVLLGILVPLVVVVLWSYLMAPKAKRRLSWPAQPLLALLLFVLAGLGLIVVKLTLPGVILMVLAVLNAALSFYLHRGSGTQQQPQVGKAKPEQHIQRDVQPGDDSAALPPEPNS